MSENITFPKAYTEYLWFDTRERVELISITDKVREAVRKSGVLEGLVHIGAMHITAAIWVNDNESGLHQDIGEWVERLAPRGPNYRHHRTGEDNGDAHLKALLLGRQLTLPVTNGELDLGPWESVFYHEFDGRRRKRVVIKVLGF
jgi:secondary thiamine-phosphate synthase enzyme